MTIRLVLTCRSMPEQYEAYLGDEQIGYMTLRRGYFRVDFPDHDGVMIYEASTRGHGEFYDEQERNYYLRFAVDAIQRKLAGESPPLTSAPGQPAPAVEYEIDSQTG